MAREASGIPRGLWFWDCPRGRRRQVARRTITFALVKLGLRCLRSRGSPGYVRQELGARTKVKARI